MPAELNLQFPDPEHVLVSCDGEDSGALPFASPLTPKDRQDLRWYLEVYGAHSLGDPDDGEAQRIAAQLPVWGKRLFEAVFSERAAERIFNRFQDAEDDARLLTISAEHPTILALPWELLHDPSGGGVFLFREISIRRRLAGAGGGRKPFQVKSKDRLHLLFVVSRPEGAGFLDPRADLFGLSRYLGNLVVLLLEHTSRLSEARKLAEEALSIMKTMDPSATEIWKMYNLLADIAEKEAAGTTDSRGQAELRSEAREHRRLAREHQRNFAGTRQKLQRHLPLITATVMATQDPAKKELTALAVYADASWNELVAAIRRILAGERDADVLCAALDAEDSITIETILAALADPSTLEALLPPDGQAN